MIVSKSAQGKSWSVRFEKNIAIQTAISKFVSYLPIRARKRPKTTVRSGYFFRAASQLQSGGSFRRSTTRDGTSTRRRRLRSHTLREVSLALVQELEAHPFSLRVRRGDGGYRDGRSQCRGGAEVLCRGIQDRARRLRAARLCPPRRGEAFHRDRYPRAGRPDRRRYEPREA